MNSDHEDENDGAMEGRRVPINSASKAELRDFLTALGGKPTNFDNEDMLRRKITATGYEESFIVVPESDDAAVPGSPARKVMQEPTALITVLTQEGAGGKRSVFVGCNGVGMLIPRNQRVRVKLRYVGVLENAIETKYELNEELNEQEAKDIPSYPFQVHELPSPAEVEAWRAYERETEAETARRLAATAHGNRAAA